MRKSLKTISVTGIFAASLVAGQAISDTTTIYNGPGYSQTPYDRGQSTQPYNEIRSELSYAKRRADGTLAGSRSSSASSISRAMERASAYRDAGDMKNACRWATRALDMAYRYGLDRNSPMFTDIIAQQAEFCSAAA